MAVAYPMWYALKNNILSILQAVAAEEATEDPGRNFVPTRDRWRPWIEKQQGMALANIMVDTVDPQGGGSRRFKEFGASVNIDMYALGNYEEQGDSLYPADEVAAARLDLLCAQVLSAITRMINQDLGFDPGMVSVEAPRLQYYSQEVEESTGQYAPARWSFVVNMPYYPEESDLPELTEINFEFNQALENWSLRYPYTSE